MGENTSAEKGRLLFIKKCEHCHSIEKDAKHKSGPNLFGIINKKAGTVPGYKYSKENKNLGIIWTEEHMNSLLINPQAFMPGSRMFYPEMKKAEDRLNIIEYLKKCCE